MLYEVGALLNCFLCDSYFIFVVYQFDVTQLAGKRGKTVLDDVYAEISALISKVQYTLQRCPVSQTYDSMKAQRICAV